MKKNEKLFNIFKILDKEYGKASCSLTYDKPYQLLMAARLSAQCTDERVNKITPVLFSKYKSLEEIADADPADVMEIVRSCGFYHTKGQNIVDMAKMLICKYGGVVPNSIDELIKLPGVGRKTANLIVGDIYKKPAIVADTHCIRLSNRLGLCDTRDPKKVEIALKNLIPPDRQSRFCHQLVWHGRKICKARKPDCGNCPLALYCKSFNNAD